MVHVVDFGHHQRKGSSELQVTSFWSGRTVAAQAHATECVEKEKIFRRRPGLFSFLGQSTPSKLSSKDWPKVRCSSVSGSCVSSGVSDGTAACPLGDVALTDRRCGRREPQKPPEPSEDWLFATSIHEVMHQRKNEAPKIKDQ